MPREPQFRLPTCFCADIVLRELVSSDAPFLNDAFRADSPPPFIPAPPDSVDGYERFIAIYRRKCEVGQGGCVGVVPRGADGPIGLFQFSVLPEERRAIEWGFILSTRYWGTGVFVRSAGLVLDFLFHDYRAERVQGRCAVENSRAISALRKLGAVPGPISYEPAFFDRPRQGQVWTILADTWRQRNA